MSILRRAIGGGIAGLGEGIEKRAMIREQRRGEALRHRYMMERQKDQQRFAAGQQLKADAQRIYSEGEDRKLEERGLELEERRIQDTREYNEKRLRNEDRRIQDLGGYHKAQIAHLKNIDKLAKGKLAQELALAEAQSEFLKRELEELKNAEGGWKTPFSEKDAQAFADSMYPRYATDEDGNRTIMLDEEFNPVVNHDAAGKAVAIYRQEGKWPREIEVTPEDLVSTMATEGISLEEAIASLNELQFQMPNPMRLIGSRKVQDYLASKNRPARTRPGVTEGASRPQGSRPLLRTGAPVATSSRGRAALLGGI